MKLTFDRIRQITKGAAYITDETDGIHFHRFTPAQEEYYRPTAHRDKACATAGVRLSFLTDSKTLTLKVHVTPGSSRTYFAHDLLIDGTLEDSLDNFTDLALPPVYTGMKLPQGYAEKTFSLTVEEDVPGRMKRIDLCFPWSVRSVLEELSLDDGASLIPVQTEKKMLQFGDSITHGYDALHPAAAYSVRLADALGMEAFNKAIGGEMFCPGLAALPEDFLPDVITAAYGTNDWSNRTPDVYAQNCRAFFETLRKTYPTARIFALLPLWRGDQKPDRQFGDYAGIYPLIRQICEETGGIDVIDCYDFIPKDASYFADRVLHPNDAGFTHYFHNLYTAVRERLHNG